MTSQEYEKILASIKSDERMLLARMENLIEKYSLVDMGLTLSQAKIMMVLYYAGELTHSEILRAIPTSASNLSQRLNSLQKQQLISQTLQKKSQDKRSRLVKLTKQGRTKYELAEKQIAAVKSLAFRHFSLEELQPVMEYYMKLANLTDTIERELAEKFGK